MTLGKKARDIAKLLFSPRHLFHPRWPRFAAIMGGVGSIWQETIISMLRIRFTWNVWVIVLFMRYQDPLPTSVPPQPLESFGRYSFRNMPELLGRKPACKCLHNLA